MSGDGTGGRLLRGGRVVARVLLVWALAAGALVLLDDLLTGFRMADWWQPLVFALLFGVLSAMVWPLVLRVALPIALFTLGVGSYLLLGAGTITINHLVYKKLPYDVLRDLTPVTQMTSVKVPLMLVS